jgi:hypothetical protein
MRVGHEARPVMKGTKYAANSWIHLYEYDKPVSARVRIRVELGLGLVVKGKG